MLLPVYQVAGRDPVRANVRTGRTTSNGTRGAALIVRRARRGEKLTLLDGREVVLSSEVMVLADGKDAHDTAGVKGDRGSNAGSGVIGEKVGRRRGSR